MQKHNSSLRFILSFLILFIYCHRNTQPPPSNKTLLNGDFEQELNIGWIKNTAGLNYSDAIERARNLDSDDDYELMIEKVNAGHIKLLQTIDVSTTSLNFSVSAKLQAIEHNSYASYWAAAAICLRYLNESNQLLGETRITHKSPNCPWQNNEKLHLINVPNPDNWYTYGFNINDELANLSAVNLSDIKKIQVVLMDTTNGC